MGVVLAAIHVPLGTWIYRVFSDPRHTRAERLIYRLVGVDPDTEQRWTVYATSILAFSAVSIAGLWLLIVLQGALPWSFGRSMHVDTAFNTAVSFVTNTNWQSYSGESGTGYTVQALGLTVQNFLAAGAGLAVAIALVRGLARHDTDRFGNFWVDLTRGTLRLLLPLSLSAAVVLLLGGVIQNLHDPATITTIAGGQQVIQGGPVASQEAIKLLGTNGGGFLNANSAHPPRLRESDPPQDRAGPVRAAPPDQRARPRLPAGDGPALVGSVLTTQPMTSTVPWAPRSASVITWDTTG